MNARELTNAGIGLVLAVFLSGCLIVGFGMLGIAGHQGPPPDIPEHLPAYNRTITLDIPLPPSPATVPQYRVVSVEQYSTGTGTALAIKNQIPSVGEAPGLAEKALAAYGGVPADAVLERTDQEFLKKYNLKTGTVEEQYPQYTRVTYRQYVNGSPVMNSEISVSLGEGGGLLDISKDWSTLEYAGEIPVISADEAFEKLQARDLFVPIQSSLDGYHITRVQQGYYILAGTRGLPSPAQVASPDVCTPVWVFYGVKPGTDIDPFPLLVNATRG